MRHSLVAFLMLSIFTGCAPKKPAHISTAGSTRLYGCREVSINAKTGEITVICPPQGK